ncbi:MAG: hypothetical protein Q9217_002230 [Psora testacea]
MPYVLPRTQPPGIAGRHESCGSLRRTADALEVRDNAGAVFSILDERAAHGLTKRDDDIVTLFTSITNAANKAAVGATKYWNLKTKDSARYTTSEFYGCTVVVVVNGLNVVIGHYGEVAGCVVMEDNSAVQNRIIRPLEENLAFCDFDDNAHAWIIHTSSQNSVGYKAIQKSLRKFGVEAANIKDRLYPSSSGVGGFPGLSKGKVVVDWESKEQGNKATMKVYIEGDTPKFTQDYDCNGDPV